MPPELLELLPHAHVVQISALDGMVERVEFSADGGGGHLPAHPHELQPDLPDGRTRVLGHDGHDDLVVLGRGLPGPPGSLPVDHVSGLNLPPDDAGHRGPGHVRRLGDFSDGFLLAPQVHHRLFHVQRDLFTLYTRLRLQTSSSTMEVMNIRDVPANVE